MRGVDRDELAAEPVGRYHAGDGFAHFCARPELWGFILWGRPDAEAVEALTRSLVAELSPPAVPHGSLVDTRRLGGVDAGAFSALEAYVRDHLELLRKQVTRLALVRPTGMQGAVVAGFFEVLERPYPVEVFEEPADALGWLGMEEPDRVAADLDRIYEQVSATPSVVGRLRAHLTRDLGATVTDVAKALSTSERTLQRRLREAGTTFQDELGGARVREAQRLLLDGDAPVTQIALEVGCASLQHFSALFRKHVGESPSAWRSRNRR